MNSDLLIPASEAVDSMGRFNDAFAAEADESPAHEDVLPSTVPELNDTALPDWILYWPV